MRRLLFDDLRFTGNVHDYYDPGNSFLDRVVATRCGIPITLSVLTISVARRVGVELVGQAAVSATAGVAGHALSVGGRPHPPPTRLTV